MDEGNEALVRVMPTDRLSLLEGMLSFLPPKHDDALCARPSHKLQLQRAAQVARVAAALEAQGVVTINDLVGKYESSLADYVGVDAQDLTALRPALNTAGYAWENQGPFALTADMHIPMYRADQIGKEFAEGEHIVESYVRGIVANRDGLMFCMASRARETLHAHYTGEGEQALKARSMLKDAKDQKNPVVVYGHIRREETVGLRLPAHGIHYVMHVYELYSHDGRNVRY